MTDSTIRLHDPTWRQIQKYRGKAAQKAGVDTLTLPTGAVVTAEQALGKNYRGIRPPGADRAFALHSPEKYIRDPKPGCKYIWRTRNDSVTYGLVEAGRIHPVSAKRIRREVKGTQSIYAYAGPPDTNGEQEYAAWGLMALFEASPEATEEWYSEPERYDLSRLISYNSNDGTNPTQQAIIEAGERAGVKVENVEVSRTDVRKAGNER